MFVIYVLALMFTPTSAWFNCTPVCSCAKDDHGDIRARCAVQRLPCDDLAKLPHNVYSLTIENSSLSRIPLTSFRGLERLRKLSLKGNNIRSIDRGALKTLDSLTELDLRDNDIIQWRVFSPEVLPSLKLIDMSGNKRWRPGPYILKLQNLTEVRGVTWSSYCSECELIKTTKSSNDYVYDDNVTMDPMDMKCHVEYEFFYQYKDVPYQTKNGFKFFQLGFSPQCLCNSIQCSLDEISHTYLKELYSVPKKLFNIQYALGAFIFLINFMIFVVVISSEALRTNASFILVCSMSLSDLCIGVYTIGIAIENPFKNNTIMPVEITENKSCSYLGVIFTIGQTTTVFTSFFLTVERYLAIVRCIKPRQKLGLRLALVILLCIWLTAILFAFLPTFGVKQLQYHKWFQCTMPFHKSSEISDLSTVTLIIVICFVMVYIASVALYIFMYCVFCKSTAHLAVRREARLAKRLVVVVTTNFVFFVIPNVLFLVYVYRFQNLVHSLSFPNLQRFIIMGTWIPVTLLATGSTINPFLYALRHQKFRKEIARLCRRLDKYFSETTQEEPINSPHLHPDHQHQIAAEQMRQKELEYLYGNDTELLRKFKP